MPLWGRRRYQRLADRLESDPAAKLKFFRKNAGRIAMLSLPVLMIGLLAGRGPRSIGLTVPVLRSWGMATAVYVLAVLGAVTVRLAVNKELAVRLLAKAHRVLALLPVGRTERNAWAIMALSAGVFEEVMFRGFGIAFVDWAPVTVGPQLRRSS
jgi:uncharacterized protein